MFDRRPRNPLSPILPSTIEGDSSSLSMPAPLSSKAVTPLSLVCHLSEKVCLGREPNEDLVLEITVSRRTYENITKVLRESLSDSGTISNVHLLQTLRSLGADDLRHKASFDRLRAARAPSHKSAHGSLSQEEYLLVKAALTFLWGACSTLAASRLTVRLRGGTQDIPLQGGYALPSALVEARTIFEQAVKKGPSKGFEPRWPQAVQKAREKLRSYEEVYKKHTEGHTGEEVARAAKLNPITVSAWLRGAIPREIGFLRQWSDWHRLPSTTLPLPRESDPDIATLLGSYQASVRRTGPTHLIELSFPDKSTALRILAFMHTLNLARDTSVKEITTERGSEYELAFYSRPLIRGLNLVTRSNDRVPWEYLGDDAEITAYLKAFFFLAGSAVNGTFRVTSKSHPTVVIGVATLLQDLGVPVDISEGRYRSLTVASSYGLARMHALDLLSPRHLPAIEERLREKDATIDPRERYDQAFQLQKANPKMDRAAIASELGLPYMTVVSWLVHGKRPRAIVAREKLNEWKSLLAIPHGPTVAHLHRRHSMPLAEAEKIGAQHTLSDLAPALTRFEERGVSIAELTLQDFTRLLHTLTPQPREPGLPE